MRIAYITYEYPPDIGLGGIATYNFQIARMMKERGHDVEVFCGSFTRNISEEYNQVLTHRIKISDVIDFRYKVVNVFAERHAFKPFDLFESPEINANGIEIKSRFTYLPMVVKIHMPVIQQIRLLNYYTSFYNKLRFSASNLLKKGKIELGLWSKHAKQPINDIDYLITQKANLVSAPSKAMKDWAVNFWRLPKNKIEVIPYPFIPSQEYLSIPIKSENNRVLFIGKLNVHKGLVKLTDAILIVLKKVPYLKFRFVATDGSSHIKGLTMKEYMQKRLEKYEDNIEFIGSAPLHEIPEHLKVSDFCIFPSIWECFGLVVCESMAAARVPIVSKNGGMKEIVDNNKSGIVINPHNSKQIAKSIIELHFDKQKREKMAIEARNDVKLKYNAEIIGKMTEDFYNKLFI